MVKGAGDTIVQKATIESAYNYLKSMLDNIADPIFVKNRNHCWIDGNKAFWEFMGGGQENFIGKSDYDFFPKEEADIFWEKDNQVFETGKTVINEESLTDHKGRKRIISTKKTLFLNEKGEQVLIGIIRDITLEKELEELKKDISETVISQKEQQYRSIFESTNDAILIFNMDGYVVEANREACRIYGYGHEEFIGKNAADLSSFRFKFARLMEETQAGKRYFYESTHFHKNGDTIAIEVNGTAFQYAGKSHLLAVIRDISEHKRVQDALREADRRKDEFLAMLAHELRNPLAPISNAVHVMKSLSVSDRIRLEAASLIERQVTQMTQLLNDLLDASRVTLGKIELRRHIVSLSEIINTAVENTRPLMESRGHNLIIRLPDYPVWFNADSTRLAQVFTNLLNNAAKYTQNSGRIVVSASEDKAGVTISISDNGIGIEKKMQPHVFELFAQADSSMERAQGGLGIGLTLVKNIVEMHMGSISVNSEGIGKGSEFTVCLPAQIKAKEEKPEAVSDIFNTPISYQILVIDDNAASAKTLGWMLEMMGHEVQLAHGGREGIEIAKIFMPHIILLDIGLPEINGYEVCELLRREPKLKDTVIVAQTGWGKKEDILRAKAAGFNYHLVKPVNIEMLQKILVEVTFPYEPKRVQVNFAL
jgi:PAS domain S-box-containing protein